MKILNLILIRKHFKDSYTIGNLFCLGSFIQDKEIKILKNEFLCNIIEDKFRGNELTGIKVKDKTAVPEGSFEVKMTYSPKFKKMLPEILNVPFFTGIRIHAGTSADDSSGCLICGYNKVVGKVVDSRVCLKKITDEIKSYDLCYITIKKEIF